METVPSGTVTLLFTDIEGSTRLLRRAGDAYADLLTRHRALLRSAFAAHHGREVGVEGDALFVVFGSAREALLAAADGQRALATHAWPDGCEVRVRMGLHTGEPRVVDGDYVGIDVHRAARVMAAGHGGQVLLSQTTRDLVADDNVTVHDLGAHRLRDIVGPQQLYQLEVDGLPSEFPALRTLHSQLPGLPAQLTPLIGRDRDIEEVVAAVLRRDVRTLTLLGPGGVGKTTLALGAAHAAADAYRDGVGFVELARVARTEDVAPAMLQTLELVPQPGETAEESIVRSLANKHLLLLLDNFEHVLEAAPIVPRLLSACAGLTVLATSREPLGVRGEARRQVAPLALPHGHTADIDAVGSAPAVKLFVARAREHDPRFVFDAATAGSVAQICRRLNGLPLAIELAAARCSLMSPSQVARRLDDAFAVLGTGPRDAPERQRTLRATIDWSHALLGPAERSCFARFAVFAGGATVEATEEVTGASLDAIGALVDKNLLVRREGADGSSRLFMLETIRAYAAERFAARADRDALVARHFAYYLAMARLHADERAVLGPERTGHLAALDADRENLHAALRRALERPDPAGAVALAAALIEYWRQGRDARDALNYVDRALTRGEDTVDSPDLVELLAARTSLARWLGRKHERPDALTKAEALARRSGDDGLLVRVLLCRADEESSSGRIDTSEHYSEEALRRARVAGDDWAIALALQSWAMAAGTIRELRARVDQAMDACEAIGSRREQAGLLSSASYAALCLRAPPYALELATQAMRLVRGLDDDHVLMLTLGNLALATALAGDVEDAAAAFREELHLCRERMERSFAQEGIIGMAAVAAAAGDAAHAARLVGASGAHGYGMEQPDVKELLDAAFFDAARARLGSEAWQAAVYAGAALSFHDAIAEALGERSDSAPTPGAATARAGA